MRCLFLLLVMLMLVACDDKTNDTKSPAPKVVATKTPKPAAPETQEPPAVKGPVTQACDFPQGHCIERRSKKAPNVSYKVECEMKRGTFHEGGCPEGMAATCALPEKHAGNKETRHYYGRHEDATPSAKNKNKAWGKMRARCEGAMWKGAFSVK